MTTTRDGDAELAALRRRAYGPEADIAGDVAALTRLAELERRHSGGAVDEVVVPAAADAPRRAPGPSPDHPEPPAGPPPGMGRSWHTTMVVAVAVLAAIVGGAAAASTRSPTAEASAPSSSESPVPAFAFASDPASTILLRIPLNGPTAYRLDLPEPQDAPSFPTRNPLAWSEPLGEYYGFRLWIARDDAGFGCIAIDALTPQGRCVSDAQQARGALFVSVPYAAISDDQRPAGMTTDQSIGFWWVPSDTVIVLTGRTSDAGAR